MGKKNQGPSWFKMWLHHRPLIDAVPDDVAGRAVKAAMKYFATGEIAQLGQLEMVVFNTIKSNVDEAISDYQRDVENGKKGGRPTKKGAEEKPPVRDGNPPLPTVTERDGEGERDGEEDGKGITADNPPAPTKPPRKSHGEFGWVKLTDSEYNRLLNDLGEAEVKRCITYVDESAQTTGNKNKWRDWNLVVRKCSKQGWGLNQRFSQKKPGSHEHSIDRLARLYEEEFQG